MDDSLERSHMSLEAAGFDLADAKHLEMFTQDKGQSGWHSPLDADRCFTSGEPKGSLTVTIEAMAEAREQANKAC